MSKRILVTATPPTTNGDLHLGHLSGPFLGADIYTRAQRLQGHEVLYVSSTDDNQSYIPTKALQENRTPQAVVEDYSVKIRKSLELAQIQMDCFTSPTREEHVKRVQDFFLSLFDKGHLKIVEEPSSYCENCERFLFEAYAKGGCPVCGKSSGGNICEECGHPNEPHELHDVTCSICGTKPIVRPLKKVVLPLEEYRQPLQAYAKQHAQKWRPHVRQWFEEMMASELKPVTVTNVNFWGIPVPLPGFEGHIINVWFEMLPGLIESTNVCTEQKGMQEDWWAPESQTERVHFFGFDNTYYFVALQTVALLAAGDLLLADNFISNEFYLLDHKKFSTSRKHAVWGNEFFSVESSNWGRYHLCLTNPETEQTNFSLSEYRQTVEERIQSVWKPVIESAIEQLAQGFEPAVPSADVSSLLSDYSERFQTHYNSATFSLRGAALDLHRFVEELQVRQPAGSASDTYSLLRAFCLFASPIMPVLGELLWKYLGGESLQDLKWDVLFTPSRRVQPKHADEVLAAF